MPKAKANESPVSKLDEPEKPVEHEKSNDSDERVAWEGDNDDDDLMDEEVEYEEVEEEEVEEEEVEEEEAEPDTNGAAYGKGIDRTVRGDKGQDRFGKHAELLALPPHGSEVYIGGISRDASEEELRHFCESIGEVSEVRLMKGKDSSENKGFAFVSFKNVELANKAIQNLNNAEFKGKKVKCSTSQARNRLFIGNVPRHWSDEDLKKAVKEVGPGITNVELIKNGNNSQNNRGFAFIEYHNHACAEYSWQKMINPKFKLDNNAPNIRWADPKHAEFSPASQQVKVVYLKNLPKDVTEEQLKNIFEQYGKITKITLPPAKPGQEKSRIGFVHFADRSSTTKALQETEKFEINGQVLECSLAKPQAEQKSTRVPTSQNSALLPSYAPPVGFGMVGGAFGVGAAFGATNFVQPVMYGRGPSPAGMAMMPMLLPDGRIGYMLQQPGAQLYTPPLQKVGSWIGGGSGSRGGGYSSASRHGNDGGRGRRYRPY